MHMIALHTHMIPLHAHIAYPLPCLDPDMGDWALD
jgi:hypothetical protein